MTALVPTTLGLKAYRNLAAIADPLITLLLRRRVLQGKEDPIRIGERRGMASRPRPQGPLLWIHGASVGESLSALPLIEKLTSARGDLQVLVTTGTLTSAQLMAERLPNNAIHQFVPLDHPRYWDSFYQHWQPDLAVIIESELWPNMIMSARERAIPMVLTNARLSEKSAKGWMRVRRSIGSLLGSFCLVLAQDELSAIRLKALGADPVAVWGNLKFDAPALVADQGQLTALLQQIGDRPCWVAASTHDGEEALTGRLHKQLKERFPNLLTIIAPRHPVRGATITTDLRKHGLIVAQRSNDDKILDQTDIYLADTLGEMGLVFGLAPIAFIGGSFVEVGGHNPLEAARLNTAVLLGPHMFNFADVTQNLLDENAAHQVHSEGEMFDTLLHWLSEPSVVLQAAACGKEAVAVSTGVAERIAHELLPLLPPPTGKMEEGHA